jgi:hypothetical protein
MHFQLHPSLLLAQRPHGRLLAARIAGAKAATIETNMSTMRMMLADRGYDESTTEDTEEGEQQL